MFVFLTLLSTIFVFCETKNINSNKCHDPKQDFYPYLSTRTAYEFVHGNLSRPNFDCEPVQIWMMSRHGARYPATNVIERVLTIGNMRDQIVKNHEQGFGQLCEKDLEKLRQWKLNPSVSTESADHLAPQGGKNLQTLAQRLRDLYPELLESSSADEPHAHCPAFVSSFIADRMYAERNKFTTGPEIQQLLKDLSRRLGFSDILDFSTARLIYEVCRLEMAWNPDKQSTWCTVFTKDDLIVLEYREDLDYYYCCGPGRDMNAKLSCPSVRDMFQRFEQIENGKIGRQPKGIFYFAHTTNIQSLMSALHIGQEPTPLLATNFESSKNRIYRASLMGPFNANLIAVLYKCNDQNDSPYKVMFYLNENLVQMEGCDNGVCDLQFLKRKFGPEINQCSMDFCYENVSADEISEIERIIEEAKRLLDTNFDRTYIIPSGSVDTRSHILIVAISLILGYSFL